jgi:hypothetical protein
MKVSSSVLCAAMVIALSAATSGQAPGKTTVVSGLQSKYTELKRNIQETAEKMPDADFAFRPMPDIRTFGELFGHMANSQFNNCSGAKGEANPNQGTDNELKTTKAELIKALNASFEYCDGAYAALTEQNAGQFVKSGENEVTRGYALLNNVWHNAEMYGAAATYLRLKNLITREGMDDLRRHR